MLMASGRRWTLVVILAVLVAAAVAYYPRATPASGTAAWPDATVRMVALAAPGGGTDVVARILAEALAERWGRPVIVDNRPGADGVIAARALIGSRDGHTLLFSPSSIVTVNPLLRASLPYDPIHDLVPIAPVAEVVIGVVCAPSFEATSVAELVALARSRPRALTYTTVFGAPQLLWLALQRQAGVEMTLVGYRNPQAAIPDLLEGRVHVALLPLGTVLGQVRAGAVRLLAVMSLQRSPVVPDVPTLTEAGYPDLFGDGILGVFGPRGIDAERREWIAQEVAAVIADSRVAQRLWDLSYVASARTRPEYVAALDEQRSRLESIARAEGVKPR